MGRRYATREVDADRDTDFARSFVWAGDLKYLEQRDLAIIFGKQFLSGVVRQRERGVAVDFPEVALWVHLWNAQQCPKLKLTLVGFESVIFALDATRAHAPGFEPIEELCAADSIEHMAHAQMGVLMDAV